jgi:serine-type D-Ala-D-Ala carboxypeptidase
MLRMYAPVLLLLLLAGCAARPETDAPASASSAQTAGPELSRALAHADSVLQAAVIKEQIPGAVLVVSQAGRVLHERAYGYAQLYDYGMRRLPQPRAMTTSTVFDLASVTKVMATTFAIMMLVDRKLVELDAPVRRYLPTFSGPHLDSITVRHLLTHSSGLMQWQPLYYAARNKAQTFAKIRSLPLQWGVGAGRHYSDLGFLLLGFIVEQVSGKPLDAFLQSELYGPLGLRNTTFKPKQRGLREFAATSHGNPYERKMVYDTAFGYDYDGDPTAWNGWREYTLVGEVNDGNAYYANEGMAGHAGLFSTARELDQLLQVLLNKGVHRGRRFLGEAVIDTFTAKRWFDNGLGWAVPRNAPEGSFTHGGFTGTYVLGVPKYKLGVVLLINRQNLGVNREGYYPSPNALQSTVVDALLRAAEKEAGLS